MQIIEGRSVILQASRKTSFTVVCEFGSCSDFYFLSLNYFSLDNCLFHQLLLSGGKKNTFLDLFSQRSPKQCSTSAPGNYQYCTNDQVDVYYKCIHHEHWVASHVSGSLHMQCGSFAKCACRSIFLSVYPSVYPSISCSFNTAAGLTLLQLNCSF